MKKLFLICIVLILQLSCTEEEIKSRPYPRVRTKSEVTDFTGGTAVFHGSITYITSAPITDHGFVWSTSSNLSLELSEKVSLGPKDSTGDFESEVDYTFQLNTTYYIRAYALTDTYTVFGEMIEFIP
ncbi:MAG TPA: hypothetical protein VGK59_14705 [Ohtaekwangia sp.]